jgi:hypothetical protein
MKLIIYLIASSAALFSLSASSQSTGEPSLLKLLEQEEGRYQKSQQYQGQPQTKEQILQSAKENAQSNSNVCPTGALRSNSEDIRSYIERQEALQNKIAASIERFYRKELERNAAIGESNSFVNESNELINWGKGKVTDGACNRPEITDLISKSYKATKNLIEKYQKSF